MSDVVLLRGGSREGESTTVQPDVRRLLAASRAPGMLEVYEDSGEQVEHEHGAARVFVAVDMQPAGDTAPELLHSPST